MRQVESLANLYLEAVSDSSLRLVLSRSFSNGRLERLLGVRESDGAFR